MEIAEVLCFRIYNYNCVFLSTLAFFLAAVQNLLIQKAQSTVQQYVDRAKFSTFTFQH